MCVCVHASLHACGQGYIIDWYNNKNKLPIKKYINSNIY